jgi:hypothetical protein
MLNLTTFQQVRLYSVADLRITNKKKYKIYHGVIWSTILEISLTCPEKVNQEI